MHRILKKSIRHEAHLAVLFAFLAYGFVPAPAQAHDVKVWSHYSQAQRRQAVAGFVHCYRMESSNKVAFANIDVPAVVQNIDRTALGASSKIANVILRALKDAPAVKLDIHAEHWDGPYGFATGMWWRGLDDHDRDAYVQGVFWCAETSVNIVVSVPEKSVRNAVNRLNDWYVVSDDDWKDPRSTERVDVPVVEAMQLNGLVIVQGSKGVGARPKLTR